MSPLAQRSRYRSAVMMRVLAPLLIALLFKRNVALAQDGASVEARTSTLSWTRLAGAEMCPTLPAMATQMDTLTGRSVITVSSDAALVIEAYVEALPTDEAHPEGPHFRATVHISTRGGEVLGERLIETSDPTCAALLERAALAMVLMIDPDTDLTGTRQDAPATEPTLAPIAERLPITNPHRITVDLGAGIFLAQGPSIAPSGHLRVLIVPAGFVPLGIVGALAPWSRATYTDASIDFLNVLGGITICPLFFHDDVGSLELCGGVDVGGALVVANSPSIMLREKERLLVQLDVNAVGRITLIPHWLVFHANLSLFVPFRGEPWRLAGSDIVYYRPEPVAAMFGVGLSVDLPFGAGSQ